MGDPGSQKGSSSYASHPRTPTARSVQQTPVRLIAATSGGPKGGWPPAQRSWRPATRAQAASRPVWLSAARSPAPRHRWTVWRGWPHRPPRRCPAIRSGSKPSRPVRARVSPGLHPATGATPRRACACATCVHPGLNRSHQKLLSLSSSSPSCGSRPLTGCLSEPGSAALHLLSELGDLLLQPARLDRKHVRGLLAVGGVELPQVARHALLDLRPAPSPFNLCKNARGRLPHLADRSDQPNAGGRWANRVLA